MPKRFLLLSFAFLPISLFCQKVNIVYEGHHEQIAFGIKKIKEAINVRNTSELTITIVTDSVKAKEAIRANGWKESKSFNDQCYAIRIKQDAKIKNISVLAGESKGAMYGALDIAEAVKCNSIDQLKESDNIPYLTKRGIKFNIP